MATPTLFKRLLPIAVLICFALLPSWASAVDQQFMTCLSAQEGKATSVNPWGYSGAFQFGVDAAASTGLCVKDTTQTFPGTQDWSHCDFSKGQYCPPVCSYADFISGSAASVSVQQQAEQKFAAQDWATIQRVFPDVNNYIGQTVNGVTVTQDVLLAIAHLRGPGSVSAWLQGQYVKPDGNGTTPTGYATCVAECLNGDPNASTCDPRTAGGWDTCVIATTPAPPPANGGEPIP